ncbi:MAG: hypothetical protein LRY39_00405 [Alphaproteobacteria bacterium]|nr:hypothetical protein [Alphaproteobacteria bacterium]
MKNTPVFEASANSENKKENQQDNSISSSGLLTDKPVVAEQKIDSLREKISTAKGPVAPMPPVLGGLKIKSAPAQDSEDKVLKARPVINDNAEEEALAFLTGINAERRLIENDGRYQTVYWVGGTITALWFAFSAFFVVSNITQLVWTPQDLGGMFAGIFAPPALFWLIVASLNRKTDVELYAASLRSELQALLFPTEEQARVINADIERLCKQAVEVSSASRATLKSLHRARQGLRTEIRDFSTLTKKAEFHIDRLSDSIKTKSDKLIEMTGEIERRTALIEQKTQSGIDGWENATAKILARSAKMEESLGAGADRILEAADKAEEKTRSIEDHLQSTHHKLHDVVDQVTERLESLNGKFEIQTQSLESAVTHVSEETSRLGAMIKGQVEELDDIAQQTALSVTRSSEALARQREELSDEAAQLESRAGKVVDILSASTDAMREGVDYVSHKTSELEERLAEKTENLRSSIGGIAREADKIEAAGSVAANKLTEALDVAISGAETISTAGA